MRIIGAAQNSYDALRLITQEQPDVVVLEFSSEEQQSGRELCRQIKSQPNAPASSSTPTTSRRRSCSPIDCGARTAACTKTRSQEACSRRYARRAQVKGVVHRGARRPLTPTGGARQSRPPLRPESGRSTHCCSNATRTRTSRRSWASARRRPRTTPAISYASSASGVEGTCPGVIRSSGTCWIAAPCRRDPAQTVIANERRPGEGCVRLHDQRTQRRLQVG